MDQKIIKQLEELQLAVANIAKVMVTKDDLKQELTNFATKDDLAKFATKDDLNKLKAELITKITDEIKESEAFIVGSVDKKKADKAHLVDLEKRVTRIERKLIH